MSNMKHSDLALVTATHCCVCRLPLTDAESVQKGIGPICSKRYLDPEYLPTPEEVMNALGLMAVAELDTHIVDAFLEVVNGDRVKAREGANLLIYWASAHYDNRATVLKCSKIIRALGFTTLADKLEIDRTSAVVLVKDDHLEVFVHEKDRMNRDLRQIPGALHMTESDTRLTGEVMITRAKRGHKVGWTFPLAEEQHLETVLGVHIPGELMCGTRGVRKILKKSIYDLRNLRTVSSPPAPTVAPSVLMDVNRVRIEYGGTGWLHVFTPYDTKFVERLKATVPFRNRVWDPTRRCWRVMQTYQSNLLTLIEEVYGVTPAPVP